MAEKGRKGHTKVVVRLLPPTLTEDIFYEAIGSEFHDAATWKQFVRGKRRRHLSKASTNSRAYLNFPDFETTAAFCAAFHGHSFVDDRGEVFRAVVVLAPYQQVPKRSGLPDERNGTIEEDSSYLEFAEALKEKKDPMAQSPGHIGGSASTPIMATTATTAAKLAVESAVAAASASVSTAAEKSSTSAATAEVAYVTPLVRAVQEQRLAKLKQHRAKKTERESNNYIGAARGSREREERLTLDDRASRRLKVKTPLSSEEVRSKSAASLTTTRIAPVPIATPSQSAAPAAAASKKSAGLPTEHRGPKELKERRERRERSDRVSHERRRWRAINRRRLSAIESGQQSLRSNVIEFQEKTTAIKLLQRPTGLGVGAAPNPRKYFANAVRGTRNESHSISAHHSQSKRGADRERDSEMAARRSPVSNSNSNASSRRTQYQSRKIGNSNAVRHLPYRVVNSQRRDLPESSSGRPAARRARAPPTSGDRGVWRPILLKSLGVAPAGNTKPERPVRTDSDVM